jgi:protein TonB
VHPAAPTDRAPAPEPADVVTPAPSVSVVAAAPVLPVTASAGPVPVATQPAPTQAVAPAPVDPVAPTAVAPPVPTESRAAAALPVAAAAPITPATDAPRAPGVTEAAPLAVPEAALARDVPVVQTPDAATPRPRAAPTPVRAPIRQRATPAPPAPQGSAAQPSRAGDAAGVAQGTAVRTQRGTGGEAASDGRAAAAYPQLVHRHLARQRRPNTRASGGATIAFTVSANGGLVSAAVVRSSGNAELDRLALALVQGAAPFPAPPPGAQRSFQITIRGR